jgi:hypothetical protein
MANKKYNIVQGKPVQREDPFQLFFYHVKRLPWYFIKFWDWLFTLITALIVYLTR